MKYVMTYMGRTSGTFMGRDDGYPELKIVIANTLDELIGDNHKDEKFYEAKEINETVIQKAIQDKIMRIEQAKTDKTTKKKAALAKLTPEEKKLLKLN